MKRRVWLVLMLCGGAALAEQPGPAPVRPPLVAVVPFAGEPDSREISSVLEADLVRSGRIQALPREDFPQLPHARDEVDFSAWRALGVEQLVIGEIAPQADREVVRFFLLSVADGFQRLGFDMPVTRQDQRRLVAHDIADLIHQKLGGGKFHFDSLIAYVSAKGSGSDRRFMLVVAEADGHNPRVMATSREPLMSPAWSPDGRKLAYVGYAKGRAGIYIQKLETGEISLLVSEKGVNGAPSWSPDGRQMLVTLSLESNPDLYLIDIASGERKRLTDQLAIETEGVFSPDGSQIAFTSDRGGSPQIYLMPVDGGEAKLLSLPGRQNLRPRFSPDGRRLAVVNNEAGRFGIALVDLQTGSLRRLTDGRFDESPSFSPNGEILLYSHGDGGAVQLAMISTDGRVPTMTSSGGEAREPVWGPPSP